MSIPKKLLLCSIVALIGSLSAAIPSIAQNKKATGDRPAPKTKVVPVKEVRLDPATPAPSDSVVGLTVERYVQNIDVRRDGSAIQTIDIQQRYRSKTALAAGSRIEVEFNRDMNDVEFSDAYILKKNGRKVLLPADAIHVKRTPQAEAAPSFSSMMVASLEFAGLEVGDAAHYRMVVRTKRSHFEGQFDTFHYLHAVYDWDLAEINLSAPADYPLQIEVIGLNGGRLPDEGATARWQWKTAGFKAIPMEPLMLDIIATSPRISITSFKDFDSLGQAYWKHAADRAAVTPTIKALAEEVTQGMSTPEQQAYAIYEWVNKNIRYLSLVMDTSGWVPHSATEILANRYGDCKDYATVLDALLEAKGIESHTVLIRSDFGTWFPSVPIPAYFNHAILYIPSLGLFADATAANTRLGMIPQTIVGKKAVLAGTRTGVIETPKDRPHDNEVLSDVTMSIAANGDVKATATNTFKGRAEMVFRPLFGQMTAESEAIVRVTLTFYGLEGSGQITKVSNPFRLGEPFQITTDVSLPAYTPLSETGSFRIPVGVNLIDLMAMAQLFQAETRKTDLAVGAVRMAETFKVKFPAGVEADAPSSEQFSNALGSFNMQFKKTATDIEVTRELTLSKDVVASADYPHLHELVKKAAKAFAAEIPYRAPPEIAKATAANGKKRAPMQITEVYQQLFKDPFERVRSLSPADVRKLEAKVTADPADVESRRTLTMHYWTRGGKETPGTRKGRFVHRLWLVQNRPEIGDDELMVSKFSTFDTSAPEYTAIKAAWLKQVDANPENARIRTNAAAAISKNERGAAAQLLMDGLKSDPDDYRFPLQAAEIYESQPYGVTVEPVSDRKTRLAEQLKYGRLALALIKKERSEERDQQRFFLLKKLTGAAFELGEEKEAERFATELVLDFGQDASAYGYDDASHIGNIVLGRIALRNQDITKAKEHLLIAIRAPLRKPNSWLSEIDTTLAKELFERGEKATVVQYLKLCEGLSNLTTEKELFKDQARALRLWQTQILTGKTPSFNFYNF